MINLVSGLLKDKFETNANWYAPLTDGDKIIEEDSKLFFNEILVDSANLFIESILVGEYIKLSNSDELFNEIEKTLSSIYGNLVGLNIENTSLFKKVEDFVNSFKILTSKYNNFCKIIYIYNTNPSVDVVFSSSNNISNTSKENKLDKDVIDVFNNFYWTLMVTRQDHFFDESIEYFRYLIELEHLIDNIKQPFKHISGVKQKLFFLKYKWSIRQITTYQTLKNSSSTKSYLLNNVLFSVLDTPVLNFDNFKINEWSLYLVNHYEYQVSNNYYNQKFDELNSVKIEDLTFFEIHFYIKYFKDIKKDYENLVEYVNELERRESLFLDQKSIFFKNLNYALNNQFSLLIEQENVDENVVNNLRKKIKSIQNKSGNNNFFIDYKYLCFCIKRFKNAINNRQPLDTDKNITDFLQEIRGLFISCEQKIVWSENHHNLLYQLPYKESLVKYNSDTIDVIYFASSFLLPLSVEQIKKEYQELKIEFDNNYNQYEVLTSLNKELNIIKDLKKNVENTDKKSIETITIYTAVISFIVGTVSVFNFIDSFYKAVIFILIFSTSLFSFALLVFISTKGFEKIYKYKKLMLFFYLGVSALLSICFYFKCRSDDKENINWKSKFDKMIKKQDSINKINQNQILKITENIQVSHQESVKDLNLKLDVKKDPVKIQGQIQLKNQE